MDFAEEQKRKVMTLFLDVWDQACVEGACTPLDALCRHATDCGPGRACVDNACRPHCADDADCAHGTACADGLCVPASECAGADDCPADADCLEMRCLTRCAMDRNYPKRRMRWPIRSAIM